MRTIKTKAATQTLKTIDSVGGAGDKMKQGFIKAKEQNQIAQGENAQNEQEYSANQLTNMMEELNPIGQARDIAQRAPAATRSMRAGEITSTSTRTIVSPQSKQSASTFAYQKHQAKMQQQATMHHKMQTQGRNLAIQKAKHTSSIKQTQAKRGSAPLSSAQKPTYAATRPRPNHAMRNATILHLKKQQYKKTAKTAQKIVKHSGKHLRNAHTLAKTTGVAKQGAAKSLAIARRTFQQSAVTVWKTGILVAKAAKVFVIGTIAAAKSLIALCIAGGSTALFFILMLAMVGLLVASPIGIFFSNDSSNTQSLSSVIYMLHAEYDDEIAEIKDTVEHNLYRFEGEDGITAPLWQEVLPIYAIETTAQSSDDMNVISVTDANIRLLRQLLWDMHEISYRTEESERLVEVVYPDGEGGTYTEEVTVTDTTLIISLSYKNANEIATDLGFSIDQLAQLAELQSPQYDALWAGLIGGLAI